MKRAVIAASCVAMAACGAGPAMRSARTLEAGEHEVGAGLSVTRASYGAMQVYDGTGTSTHADQAKTGLVPELRAWHGLTGTLDVGSRLVFVRDWNPLIELGLQWQFHQGGPLHLAVAPTLAGRIQANPGGLFPGQALLPVLATWDVAPAWGVTAGVHAGWRTYDQVAQDPHLATFGDDSLRGVGGVLYGAMLGVDWRDDRRRAMVGLQWQHLPGRVGPPANQDYGLHLLQIALTVGWIPNKDVHELDRTDQDLDRLTRPH